MLAKCLLLFVVASALSFAAPSIPAASIYVTPGNPTANDHINLHYVFYFYGSGTPLLGDTTVSLAGNTIDVVVQNTTGGLFVAGSATGVVDIGRLSPDSYQINFFTQSRAIIEAPYQAPVLETSITVLVRETSVPITVAEYYHPTLRHYFVSADPNEIEWLDANVQTLGWAKTGQQFMAYVADTVLLGTSPVCRFYGSVTPGPNSHFYTLDSTECNFLKQLQQTAPATLPRWNFEGIAFVAAPPQVNGSCPAEYPLAVRRFYNNRALQADSNHRYVIDDAVAQQMRAAGWLDEGVVMCGLAG